MSATIYGVLYVSNASKEDLRRVLDSPEVARQGRLYDGQALYGALSRDCGWQEPLPGSPEDASGIMVWSQDYPEIIPVCVPEGHRAGGLFLVWDEGHKDPDAAVILDIEGTRPNDPSSEIMEMLFNEIPYRWFAPDTVLELSSFYNDHEDQGQHECQCGVELGAATIREVLTRIREDITGPNAGFGILGDDGEWKAHFDEESNTASLCWHEWGTDRCFGFEVTPADRDAALGLLAEKFRKPFADSLDAPEGMSVTLQGHTQCVLAVRPDPCRGFTLTARHGNGVLHELRTEDLSIRDISNLNDAIIHYRWEH